MLWSALSFKNSAKQFVDQDRFERITIAYQFIYIASVHCFDYHRAYKHAMKYVNACCLIFLRPQISQIKKGVRTIEN